MKEIIRRSILHNDPGILPLMYRAEPSVNDKLIKYFNLGNIEEDWEELIGLLGAHNFSDGETLNAFKNFVPKYRGPVFDATYDLNHFFIWGIKPIVMKLGDAFETVYHFNPPLYDFEDSEQLKKYNFPKLEWFDFNNYRVISDAVNKNIEDFNVISSDHIKKSEKYFLNTFLMNSFFMTSIFLRGIDKMLMDLVSNSHFAFELINTIGEFIIEFYKKNLSSIGSSIDLVGLWDDFATQESLMISPDIWRKYYKPWYKRFFEEVKKYDLLTCFHVCGNCSSIIGDLIDIGVDILDPVQVSAKDMEIEKLKSKFGKNICFHGGLDAQKLLIFSSPSQIKGEVRRVKKLFNKQGGIILGPSHVITPDVPIENILAIYDN